MHECSHLDACHFVAASRFYTANLLWLMHKSAAIHNTIRKKYEIGQEGEIAETVGVGQMVSDETLDKEKYQFQTKVTKQFNTKNS